MESIEKMIYDETEKRLAEMEKPGYVFPKTMGTADAIGVIASVAVSIVLIVLCVLEVIV